MCSSDLELRDGLERILRGRTGALIVLGMDPLVASLCSGGFELDVEFSATRLRELAKMDGAVVVDGSLNRIVRANVQLLPDPTIETSESGTRHRTAERVGRQVAVPTITVSEDMSVVAIHRGGEKRQLEPVARVLARADQAMQILERYRQRLDAVSTSLSAVEIEDLVTWRDVATALQRAEMVRRIALEIEEYVVELGTDGRLVLLQLEELMVGVDEDHRLLIEDYRTADAPDTDRIVDRLARLDTEEIVDVVEVARALGHDADPALEEGVRPRGYRLLARIPRLPDSIAAAVVERFGSLAQIGRAHV